jgi:hypothetical protein
MRAGSVRARVRRQEGVREKKEKNEEDGVCMRGKKGEKVTRMNEKERMKREEKGKGGTIIRLERKGRWMDGWAYLFLYFFSLT